jgi:hypothetical protein
MWNIDYKEYLRLAEEARRLQPYLLEHARAMRVRPEQLEDIRRQVEWARQAARAIDPATIQALRQVYSSQEVSRTVQAARSALGSEGLAAARYLTTRQIAMRLSSATRVESESRENLVEEMSPKRLRKAEELAASEDVRELVRRVDPEKISEEAEASFQEEGLPELLVETEEVEYYGVDLKLPPLFEAALVLYVALETAAAMGVASELDFGHL